VETLAKKSNMPADKIQAMMDEFGGFYELADVKVTVDPEVCRLSLHCVLGLTFVDYDDASGKSHRCLP
jgi:hypothetical protein